MHYARIKFSFPIEFEQEAYMAWGDGDGVTFYNPEGAVITPPEVHEVITLQNNVTPDFID